MNRQQPHKVRVLDMRVLGFLRDLGGPSFLDMISRRLEVTQSVASESIVRLSELWKPPLVNSTNNGWKISKAGKELLAVIALIDAGDTACEEP